MAINKKQLKENLKNLKTDEEKINHLIELFKKEEVSTKLEEVKKDKIIPACW